MIVVLVCCLGVCCKWCCRSADNQYEEEIHKNEDEERLITETRHEEIREEYVQGGNYKDTKEEQVQYIHHPDGSMTIVKKEINTEYEPISQAAPTNYSSYHNPMQN